MLIRKRSEFFSDGQELDRSSIKLTNCTFLIKLTILAKLVISVLAPSQTVRLPQIIYCNLCCCTGYSILVCSVFIFIVFLKKGMDQLVQVCFFVCV